MQFPNYKNSSFNVINSLMNFYGVENNHPTLKELDIILEQGKYKKIVFIVMDGMGNNIVNKYCKDLFISKKNIGPISSVFPSTTTAAMNTYYSALPPIEHAWLGWSCYFKECSRTINLFPGTDKYSLEKITFDYKYLINYEDIFSKIKKNNNTELIYVYPKYLNNNYPVKNIKVKNLKHLFKSIKKQLKGYNNKFIFAYSDEPDHSEHLYGPSNKKIEKIMLNINELVEKYFKKIKKDTLIIISADHGQIDIDETIYLEDYNEFLNTLEILPTIEPRAASFFVKKDKALEFETLFNDIFKDKYVLFKKEEVFKHHFFGNGIIHPKADDFVGDYLAVAINKSIIEYKRDKSNFVFKGHHAGMHPDEMNIPLIIIKGE